MNIRIISLTMLLIIGVAGCVAAPPRMDGTSILPPPNYPIESRKKDLSECYESAYKEAQTLPPLTEEEKAPLEGRSTVKFFREGRFVASGEYTPNMYLTAVDPAGGYGHPEVTDRYVLCFLKRGYTWPKSK